MAKRSRFKLVTSLKIERMPKSMYTCKQGHTRMTCTFVVIWKLFLEKANMSVKMIDLEDNLKTDTIVIHFG